MCVFNYILTARSTPPTVTPHKPLDKLTEYILIATLFVGDWVPYCVGRLSLKPRQRNLLMRVFGQTGHCRISLPFLWWNNVKLLKHWTLGELFVDCFHSPYLPFGVVSYLSNKCWSPFLKLFLRSYLICIAVSLNWLFFYCNIAFDVWIYNKWNDFLHKDVIILPIKNFFNLWRCLKKKQTANVNKRWTVSYTIRKWDSDFGHALGSHIPSKKGNLRRDYG